MKHYKDAIIYGAQLLRQFQGHQAPDNELATAKIPLVASGVAARALSHQRAAVGDDEEDFSFAFGSGGAFGGGFGGGGGGDDESGGEFDVLSILGGFGGEEGEEDESSGGFDFLSAFGGMGIGMGSGGGLGMGSGDDGDMDGIMQNLEQCGINVEDMASKALGAFFMLSGANMDFSSPESYAAVAPILLALKDDDEVDCEGTDSDQMMGAFGEFFKCTGINEFFDPMNFEDTALMQNFQDVCQPVMDIFLSGEMFGFEEEDLLDEDGDFAKSSKPCVQTLLGPNPFGNFIRYQYNNLDKTFGCYSILGEGLPNCVLTSPPINGDTTVSFPLSLEKKMSCMVGSSYETVLDVACTGIYEGLDKCLPQADVTNVDEATNQCAEEEGLFLGKLDFIGMDASVLTSNRPPSFCYKIFDDKNMDISGLQTRLDNYNQHREYGWTLDSIESDVAPKVEAREQPEETYKSKPVDIQHVEAVEWEDGEAASAEFDSESASGKAKSFPFAIAGVAIVGAVALALIVKHARSRLGGTNSQTNASRKEYGHIAVKAMTFA